MKAGVLDGEMFSPTEAGTPQGGIISPLLANIALHGMEQYVQQQFRQRRISPARLSAKIALIRYADDFVVIHEEKAVLEQCQMLLAEWLAGWGLAMKPSKTQLVHTLHPTGEQVAGFDFLGMTVRQFKVGRSHSGKDQRGHLLGFKTLIKPSKKSQSRHWQRLRDVIRRQSSSPQEALIREVNPIVRGWCAYYAGVVAKDIFSRMDFLMYNGLRRWAMRRHGGKHRQRIMHKYWRLEQGSWKFDTLQGVKLRYHSYTAIVRHVKILGTRSPYDGDWVYWGKRLSHHSGLTHRHCLLLKRQKGRCSYCGLPFTVTDLVAEDHQQPRIRSGGNELANCQLLHRHCHHQKTAGDGSTAARGSGA